MEDNFNSFCIYCTGNKEKEIKHCNDKFCPFYQFRFADINHEDDIEISKKLIREVGLINATSKQEKV